MLNFYNAINCFTDASITVDKDNKYIASSGYCIVKDGQILESKNKILYDATNSYGELFAVLMGIMALEKYVNPGIQLNLFSDSRISIMGLREWIFKWIQNYKNSSGCLGLISYSGTEIANQELYTLIVNHIISKNMAVGLYHILGHINSENDKKLHKARTYFNKTNMARISDDEISEMCYYNNFVDIMTRNNLKDVVYSQEKFNSDLYKKLVAPVIQIPNDMNTYKSLIN